MLLILAQLKSSAPSQTLQNLDYEKYGTLRVWLSMANQLNASIGRAELRYLRSEAKGVC
jgi:hypothetical protein